MILRSVRIIRSAISALTLLVCASANAWALPEMKVGTGFEVSPSAAWGYYSTQNLASPAWTEDQDLKRLAAALGNDPDKIYNYVHDEIDVIPMFGVKAGARGAFIDKAGTPFDQAQLMVELLRSAGITANYQLGTITLTGSQFTDWFGVSNADAAKKLLADGGYPASVTGGSTVTSVTMMHLWVKATINGTVYAFDPSFKSHSVKPGIDVAAAMGFSGSTFFSNAISGVTTGTSFVSNLNRSGIRANLDGYATTIFNYIKNNYANGSIEDIIGGRQIISNSGAAVRQASLSYQAGTYVTFAGDVPLVLRTQVTLSFNSTNPQTAHTFNWALDDIYGLQIAFEANEINPAPPTPAQFRVLLGEQDITGWMNGVNFGGVVTINHPYAAGTVSGVVNGTYMDHSVDAFGTAVGAAQIVIASGRPSHDLPSYQEGIHNARQGYTVFKSSLNQEDSSPYPQQIAARRRMATTWLVQFQDMANLVGGVGNSVVLLHDVVGISTGVGTYANSAGPAATSFMFSMEPTVSAVSKVADAAQSTKVVRTVATMSSALEGSVAQQVSDSVYPVSAVAQLDWANTGPATSDRGYFYANASNWSSIKTQILLNYQSGSPARDQAELYINAGYTVIIPKSSSLGPAPETRGRHCTNSGSSLGFEDYQKSNNPGDWSATNISFDVNAMAPTAATFLSKWLNGDLSGLSCDTIYDPDRAGAFVAIGANGSIAHISSRQNSMGKGGGGTNDVETNVGKVFSISSDFLDKQFSARAGAQNVDLKSGTLSFTPPADLVVGSGEFPYSLSFQRSFRSGMEDTDTYAYQGEEPPITQQRDPMFGFGGWTSNIHHYAQVSSDGSAAFGRSDPRLAAHSLTVAVALLSLLSDGSSAADSIERQMVGVMSSVWWVDSIQMNSISISQGHSSQVFSKLADGTFIIRGSAASAQLVGTRELWAPPSKAHHWRYKTCVKVTGSNREVVYYGVWDSGLTTCAGPAAGGRRAEEPVMGFIREVFPFGVTVTWDESTRTLSNNLGRSLVVTPTGVGLGGTVTDPGSGRSAAIVRSGTTVSVTNPLGQVWSYPEVNGVFEIHAPSNPTKAIYRAEYSTGSLGRVTRAFDGLGHITTFNIGGGRVGSVVDPLGNATRSYHDRFGNLWKVEDPLGRTTTTLYDALQRKSKVIAPEGNSEEYTYDSRSNVLTTKLNAKTGSSAQPITKSTVTYDSLCNVALTSTDALGHTTTTTINQTTCQTTSVTGPTVNSQAPVTSYSYNSIGKMIQKTDPTGLVTQVNYGSYGNPTSVVVDPGTSGHIAATTVFNYDSVGNITSLVDPRGNTHTGTYDALRRLTSYTAPASTGASTTWTYDVDGMIAQISKANGTTPSVTTYSYWATGQVRKMTDADGRVTQYDYDAANRLTYTTDPELRRGLKIYDAANEVIEERRAVGLAEEQAYARVTYTLNGKQATIKDAKANSTAYAYDDFDRLKTTTFPDNTFEQLGYDDGDNITSKVTRGGQTIQNQYDALHRLVLHIVPQPSPTTAIQTAYTYDLAGRTLTVTDTTGQGLTYGFDSAKRVTSVAQTAPNITGSRTVTYELDPAGNKTKAIWPEGYFVSYQYDALNRMTNVIENGTTPLATYVYDALSRRTSLAYGNGTSQSFTYSAGGDLLTQAHTLSGTGNTWTNSYTKAHQLLSEAASNASWQYLPAVFETTTYGAANNLNQYVVVTKGANPTVTLIYDANGNLTSDGSWTFAYDAENRLRTASKSPTTATYLYDPLGRRQAKGVDSVTTSFLSDGDEEIAEYDGSGGLLRRYVPGPGTDQPIAMVTVSGATLMHSYFHVNRQGSTVAMSNDSGTVSEGPYTYDAYGQGAPLTGVPFKYTGRRLDAETGLYYYRARYYSAALGRFLQTDPIGYRDQMNLYGYVGNDPANWKDPRGEAGELAAAGCAATIEIGCAPGAIIGETIEVVLTIACALKCGDLIDWVFSSKYTTPGGRPVREHGEKGDGEDYIKAKGWDPAQIDEVVEHPKWRYGAKDKQPKDGKSRDEPATVYGDGNDWVVVNDETGEVIAVSDRHRPDTPPDPVEEEEQENNGRKNR